MDTSPATLVFFFFFFLNPINLTQIFFFFFLIRKFAYFIKQGQALIPMVRSLFRQHLLYSDNAFSLFRQRLLYSGSAFSIPVASGVSLSISRFLFLSSLLHEITAVEIFMSFFTWFLCSISHQWRLALWMLQCRNSIF